MCAATFSSSAAASPACAPRSRWPRPATSSILTKADPRESNTGYAQGGIAAALGPDDSPELHARDTIAAGDGLCLPEAVDVLVREGPRYVRELIDWGAAFDRDADGAPALGREAAHSVRRVLHARDATGPRDRPPALDACQRRSRASACIDDALATGADHARRRAARARRSSAATAKADVDRDADAARDRRRRAGLSRNDEPGDRHRRRHCDGRARGRARRRSRVRPVSSHGAERRRSAAVPAVRGAARRGRAAGQPGRRARSWQRYEPAGDLASRDLVVARDRPRGGAHRRAGLPVDGASRSRLRPAPISDDRAGVRGTRASISRAIRFPVSPAAHYVMGGVETDLDGRTSVAGLFAAGEVACTGVHGANRLASNSLLEGLVFGARAADAMRAASPRLRRCRRRASSPAALPGCRASRCPSADEVRDLMWRHVGLVRTRAVARAGRRAARRHGRARLRRAAGPSPAIASCAAWRASSPSGCLIARAALRREESRGGHFRTDFPARDDLHWKKHVADV